MNRQDQIVPIPEEFYNSETKQPFEHCLMCNSGLSSTQYVVEKVIRNYPSLGTKEIIFEYAMCLNCAGKAHKELSEESRERIEAYMRNALSNKKVKNDPEQPLNIQQSLSTCLVKETDVSTATEYSIYGLCNGSDMTIKDFPYALSGEVQDEIMQLLSAKSLDLLDGFIGDHFSGPPEVMDILKRRPVLI